MNVYAAVAAVQAEGDEKTGVNIVLRALEEPVRTIAANAGQEGSVIVERLKKKNPLASATTLLPANGLT